MKVTPEKVSAHASLLDTLYALFRYVVVIAGSVPLLLKLLGTHDLLAIIAYFRGAEGQALIAAVVALVTAAIGLLKTFKRGRQVVSAAANPKVKELDLK